MKNIELTGNITLDNNTMDELYSEIREQVLRDIKNNGLYQSEVEHFLENTHWTTYFKIINNTIATATEKAENDKDIHWSSDTQTRKRLLAVNSILSL